MVGYVESPWRKEKQIHLQVQTLNVATRKALLAFTMENE